MTVFLPSCSHFSFPAPWQPLSVVWQCFLCGFGHWERQSPQRRREGAVSDQGGGWEEQSRGTGGAAVSAHGGKGRGDRDHSQGPRTLGLSRDQSQGTRGVFFLLSFPFIFFFITNRSFSMMEYCKAFRSFNKMLFFFFLIKWSDCVNQGLLLGLARMLSNSSVGCVSGSYGGGSCFTF